MQCSLAVRFALRFCQRAPQCLAVLVPALCVVGLPAVLRPYLSGWVYHFRCRLPGIPSIHSTTQSAACLFSAGDGFRTRILHERSLLPKFCGLSAVRMVWCDAKIRRAAPHYLPRQKTLTNHRNSLEYTQEHIPWLLKCLHYNTKLLYGQKKHYRGRRACVAMVMTGVSKIRPKRNILHLFHRPTNGFLLFSAKWTSLWNQTFLPSERNGRSEFLNWPTD